MRAQQRQRPDLRRSQPSPEPEVWQRGVPILNKVPWISRLFKNVGIGREAQSLMMMVTPRIIIQEEEEAKLGIELPEG